MDESAEAAEPLKIFIGTDETQVLAHSVLEYSIRKAATVPVEIVPMLNFSHPQPRHPENRPRSAFSFTRFLIPALCGYKGRALYLDADMLVLADVAELARIDFGTHDVLCTYQSDPPAAWRRNPSFHAGRHTAVMLLNCDRLRWNIDEIVSDLDGGRYSYEQLLSEMCIVAPERVADTIPTTWNHLERYEPGVTRLLHFTVAPTQPWKSDDNPLGSLWTSWFREAFDAGAVSTEDVERLVTAGHVRSSLLSEIHGDPEHREARTGRLRPSAPSRLRRAMSQGAVRTRKAFRGRRHTNTKEIR